MKEKKVVDLKLIKTQRSEPVFMEEQRVARDYDGRLIWDHSVSHVNCPNGEDPNRYDARIVEKHIDIAFGWCERIPGKKAKKLAHDLKKLLRQAGKL